MFGDCFKKFGKLGNLLDLAKTKTRLSKTKKSLLTALRFVQK